jgi:hypothetical protein
MEAANSYAASIHEFLGYGKAAAMSARALCEILHCSLRDISKAVERERRAGVPICATSCSTPGYYLARTKGEMLEYCDRLHKRGGEIFKTRRACLETAERLPEKAL